MKKRRLSRQQTLRIQTRQAELRRKNPVSNEGDDPLAQDIQQGLVVAHYGSHVEIENLQNEIYRCNLRQNLGNLAVGDEVLWRPQATAHGVLIASQPRRSLLARPVSAGKSKAIAANVDQVIVVFAIQPRAPQTLLDSYLVAAETCAIDIIIVLNKIDLLDKSSTEFAHELAAMYQRINYPVIEVSASQGTGLARLQNFLQARTSVFVGQSGVGKSSLLNCILPCDKLRIAQTANYGFHATHTTTTARLYHLPVGGNVIDSPGVRDFQLWDMSANQLAYGFVEFRPYLGNCQFRNCLHLQPNGCALFALVEQGAIDLRRLQSYQRLVQEFANGVLR